MQYLSGLAASTVSVVLMSGGPSKPSKVWSVLLIRLAGPSSFEAALTIHGLSGSLLALTFGQEKL